MNDVIFKYTGEQAVEDGILVDVTELAKEAGFKWITRITRTVYDICTPPKSNKIESFDGRLWDIFSVMRFQINQKAGSNDNMVTFHVKMGRKVYEFWALIDTTDGYPALHIIRPEDY